MFILKGTSASGLAQLEVTFHDHEINEVWEYYLDRTDNEDWIVNMVYYPEVTKEQYVKWVQENFDKYI